MENLDIVMWKTFIYTIKNNVLMEGLNEKLEILILIIFFQGYYHYLYWRL